MLSRDNKEIAIDGTKWRRWCGAKRSMKDWLSETKDILRMKKSQNLSLSGVWVEFEQDTCISEAGWLLVCQALDELKTHHSPNKKILNFISKIDLPANLTLWEGRALMETLIKQDFNEESLYILVQDVCSSPKRPAKQTDFSQSLSIFSRFLGD